MWAVEEVKEKIRSLVSPWSQEWTSVESAIGRAVAQPIVARRTLPPWDNSAMDGDALRSVDTSGAPVRLQAQETIFAGHLPTRTIVKGQCSRVMTGAPMPQGADAVVLQEKGRITYASSEVETFGTALPRICVR